MRIQMFRPFIFMISSEIAKSTEILLKTVLNWLSSLVDEGCIIEETCDEFNSNFEPLTFFFIMAHFHRGAFAIRSSNHHILNVWLCNKLFMVFRFNDRPFCCRSDASMLSFQTIRKIFEMLDYLIFYLNLPLSRNELSVKASTRWGQLG
jgi:hypothetical protein